MQGNFEGMGEEAGFSKSKLAKAAQTCIVCGESAEFCMRGIPKNTYCRECAENYFELLDYLDRLGS